MIRKRICSLSVIASLFGANPACAVDSSAAVAGKMIYFKGRAQSEVIARLPGGDAALSGRNFACANCHGIRGLGGREGGLRVPPIDWNALVSPSSAASLGRPRRGYDASALKRAIVDGINASDVALGAEMPRYQMSDRQLDDLISYLQIMGTSEDSDPGVAQNSIKLGSVLPLTGQFAEAGKDVVKTLRAVFDEVNAKGGIYQRKIQLVVADSGSDSTGALAATRQLIDEGVFAFVASFLPADSPATEDLISAAEVPSIGPLAKAPRASAKTNPYVWHFFPTLADQARVLVDYIESTRRQGLSESSSSVALIFPNLSDPNDAARGARVQLALHQLPIALEHSYSIGAFDADQSARRVLRSNADWLLFFGPSADLTAMVQKFAAIGAKSPAIGALLLLSPTPPQLVRGDAVTLVYASPFASNSTINEKTSTDGLSELSRRDSAFQMISNAAARTTVEVLSRAGRKLDRVGLSTELQRLNAFQTGELPPLTFSRSNRVGSDGALILSIDEAHRQFVRIRSWSRPTGSGRSIE